MDKDLLRRLLTFFADILCVVLGALLSVTIYSHGMRYSDGGSVASVSIFLLLQVVMLTLTQVFFHAYSEPIEGNVAASMASIIADFMISLVITVVIFKITTQKMMELLFLASYIITSVAFLCIFRLIPAVFRRLDTFLFHLNASADLDRVIIFGAGDAGKYLVDMLRKDRSKHLVAVAFIDDNPKLEGKKIHGIPVVGDRTLLPHAAKKYRANQVIIAIPFVDNSTIRDIFDLCCKANCTVRRFANMTTFTADALSKATINEVRVEDLLFRDVVRLDLQTVKEYIKDKTVLITGGAGSIGSELCRQILHYQAKKVIIFDFCENKMFELNVELSKTFPETQYVTCVGSVRDRNRVNEIFESYRPEIVFHAAAHKHVPMMEINPFEALKNNIIGTKNVIEAAADFQAERFILISTDKAVNPANVMGATKRICELLVKNANSWNVKTLYSAVRFGNVLGSNGSVIPLFKSQIRAGGPITVTDRNIKRYFMTIPEAVQLVLEAGALSKGGEIFVLDMGEPVKIYDLAESMIRLSGLLPEKDIKIEFTGLRPGEKLFEELNLSDESVKKTSNNRIFVLKSMQDEDNVALEDALEHLSRSIDKNDFGSSLTELSALVPTYNGNYAHRDEALPIKEPIQLPVSR